MIILLFYVEGRLLGTLIITRYPDNLHGAFHDLEKIPTKRCTALSDDKKMYHVAATSCGVPGHLLLLTAVLHGGTLADIAASAVHF